MNVLVACEESQRVAMSFRDKGHYAFSCDVLPCSGGHPEYHNTKKTCLWLKGLPPLESTNVVEPVATWCPSGSYSHKHGGQYKGMFTTDRAKNRAKTFPGVAKAMADQLG